MFGRHQMVVADGFSSLSLDEIGMLASLMVDVMMVETQQAHNHQTGLV
jgi:hypothetical protein